MALRTSLMLAIAVALALPNGLVHADDPKDRTFSVEFCAGTEYDSNVAVLELDTSSGEGDVAGLIDFGAGFHKNLTKRLKLNLDYDFSQSLHDEFDQFDIRIHRGSTEVGYDFGSVDAGVMFQYANAALDGDEFLVLKQPSPYLSKLFGKRLLLRLAYAYTDKEFTTSPGRDATGSSPSIDAFVFLDGVKSYLVFGYQHQDEDADDDQFDYTGAKLKAQLSRRATWGSRQVKFDTALRYESRGYSGPFLPIGDRREDDHYRFETKMEVGLFGHGFFQARYEYADNRSNLSSVDFDEHVVSIGVGAKL